MTWPGLWVCAASRVMEMEEVLEARITSGFKHRIQLQEEFLFEGETLRRRLDDKIAYRQVLSLQGAADRSQGLLRLGCGQFALGRLALQILANRLQPAIEKTLFDFAQHYLKPAPGKHMRNPIAHGPGAHHSHYLDFVMSCNEATTAPGPARR